MNTHTNTKCSKTTGYSQIQEVPVQALASSKISVGDQQANKQANVYHIVTAYILLSYISELYGFRTRSW